MIAQADEQGADAILNVRYATSSVAQGAAELLAYGTAVRLGSRRLGRLAASGVVLEGG